MKVAKQESRRANPNRLNYSTEWLCTPGSKHLQDLKNIEWRELFGTESFDESYSYMYRTISQRLPRCLFTYAINYSHGTVLYCTVLYCAVVSMVRTAIESAAFYWNGYMLANQNPDNFEW